MKFLLDPGHGGDAFGHYFTPGKRSPKVPPGIYEGVYNRQICRMIEDAVPSGSAFEVLTIAPGPINIPLASRVKFVNQCWRLEAPNIALISIHCNALGFGKWLDAAGFTIFKPRTRTVKHDRLAQILHDEYNYFLDIKSRGIKEANFTIIRGPICPAVLLETGFMTNKEEVEKLQRPETQKSIVTAIVTAMSKYTDFVV